MDPHLHAAAPAGRGCSGQDIIPKGQGEAWEPHSCWAQRARPWTEGGTALGEGERGCALEFKDDQGGWGQGPLFEAKITYWEPLMIGGVDRRVLPEAAREKTLQGPQEWPELPRAHPPFFCPASMFLPLSPTATADTRPRESSFQTRILYSRESGLAVAQPLRGGLLRVQPRAVSSLVSLRGAGSDAWTTKDNVPAQAVARCQDRPRV